MKTLYTDTITANSLQRQYYMYLQKLEFEFITTEIQFNLKLFWVKHCRN